MLQKISVLNKSFFFFFYFIFVKEPWKKYNSFHKIIKQHDEKLFLKVTLKTGIMMQKIQFFLH